jgi:hypothetical protein
MSSWDKTARVVGEIFILAGLFLMWYGLSMLREWLGWVVLGLFVALNGAVLVGNRDKKPSRRKAGDMVAWEVDGRLVTLAQRENSQPVVRTSVTGEIEWFGDGTARLIVRDGSIIARVALHVPVDMSHSTAEWEDASAVKVLFGPTAAVLSGTLAVPVPDLRMR